MEMTSIPPINFYEKKIPSKFPEKFEIRFPGTQEQLPTKWNWRMRGTIYITALKNKRRK